jgi:hypothetical protein
LPVTLINEQAIPGFEPNKILAALQRGNRLAAHQPSLLIPLILRAIEEVERVIRQIPDQYLDWTVPETKRTMREFTFHTFNHLHMAMTFKQPNAKSGQASTSYASFGSFREIADYGATIVIEYRSWAAKQDIKDLDEWYQQSPNLKSQAELLDVNTGSVIHHLRQLYSLFEHFGIQPEQRIPDSEWPSNYVLTILW